MSIAEGNRVGDIKDEVGDIKEGVGVHDGENGVAIDGVGDIQRGVRELVLGGTEVNLKIGGGDRVGGDSGVDGVKVEHPELQEMFTRFWFEKGIEGGIAPSADIFNKSGLNLFFNIALDCFNQGSAYCASNQGSASGASTFASGDVGASTRVSTK